MRTKLIISTKSYDKNREISHTRSENKVSCTQQQQYNNNQQQE